MSTADPSLVTVRVGDAPSSDPAGRGELGAAAAAADTAAAPVAAPKRRRLGTAGAAQVLLAAAAAAGTPAVAANPPAVARRKKVSGRKIRASAAAPAAASAAAASTVPVPAAGTESTQAFMDMLGSVDIESPPLGNYGYNEFDGGVDGGTGEDDNEVEEVDGAGLSRRGSNYTILEDQCLIRAWESISLDATAGVDQTKDRYWQRVEDKFFQLMPRNGRTVPRTFRSLQGRWETIKTTCGRWSGCLQQVINAPLSGTVEGDWDRIARERYLDMPASKRKPFVLDHCWKLLQHSEMWKLRDQEPKKGEIHVEDDSGDEQGGRNKNKPEGNKKAKERVAKQLEATSLREKLDEMVKSNETMVAKTLEAKHQLAERKAQEKKEKWEVLREEGKRKIEIEAKRASAEENKSMAKLLAEENKIMMMNRSDMDEITLEWHDIARKEILHRRKQAMLKATGDGGDGGGGGGTTV